jgi:hypothetical protein
MMPSSQAQRLRAAVLHKTLVDSMASLQVEWFIFTGSPTSGDSDRLRRPPLLHVDGSQLALAANAVTQVVYDRHLRQFITPLVEPGPTPLEPIPKRPKSSHPETQHSGGKGKGKGKGGRAVQLASPLVSRRPWRWRRGRVFFFRGGYEPGSHSRLQSRGR